MTFFWEYPIAGPDEYQNTENALRHGFLRAAFLTISMVQASNRNSN
jgi:hypothetical protein